MQQVVITKIVEEDVVKNDKALVGFPFTLSRVPGRGRSGGRVGRRAVKGASQGDFRGERAKGEGGVGEEVGPEVEDEEGGEGAQRRACE